MNSIKTQQINPNILKWARETIHMSVEDVAKKMQKSTTVIEAWENGEDTPTYKQLEKLAYKIYSRPLIIFFFPEPPKEEPITKSFRMLPESEIHKFSPQMVKMYRKGKLYQENLKELCNHKNHAIKNMFKKILIQNNSNIFTAAKNIRNFLGVPLEEQTQWKDSEEALKYWRNTIENHGIFVFKDAFKTSGISGFCIYDKKFPIIFLNNSMSKNRQIFTLFHELSHILLHMSGIDYDNEESINNLPIESKSIEYFCNDLAGEILVPNICLTATNKIDEEEIKRLASKYHVSKQVIATRLKKLNIISYSQYNDFLHNFSVAVKKPSSSGGDFYRTQKTYLGTNYMMLSFKAYYNHKINLPQLADYLNVKVIHTSKLEDNLKEAL